MVIDTVFSVISNMILCLGRVVAMYACLKDC